MKANEYTNACEQLVWNTAQADCFDGDYYCGEMRLQNGYTLKVKIEDGLNKKDEDCITFTLEKDGGVVIYGDEFNQFEEGASEYINGVFMLRNFFNEYSEAQTQSHENRWSMWDDARVFNNY